VQPNDLAQAYQAFFFKTEAGKTFMDMLQQRQSDYVSKAQDTQDLGALNRSASFREVQEHITSVIAQAAGQAQE
jgi:hypothetical protein